MTSEVLWHVVPFHHTIKVTAHLLTFFVLWHQFIITYITTNTQALNVLSLVKVRQTVIFYHMFSMYFPWNAKSCVKDFLHRMPLHQYSLLVVQCFACEFACWRITIQHSCNSPTKIFPGWLYWPYMRINHGARGGFAVAGNANHRHFLCRMNK